MDGSSTHSSAPRIEDEFPPGAGEWPEGLSRRQFINLMAASAALAGVQGCARFPKETIVPYVHQPDDLIPGLPLHFATTFTLDGYGLGIIVQSREGRPIKIEGNPDHPASLGATDVFAKASILGLYDPDRSQAVVHQGDVVEWQMFLNAWSQKRAEFGERGGQGLALLTGNFTSPTLLHQMEALLASSPGIAWFVHGPALTAIAGAAHSEQQFGYQFDRSKIVVSLDDDFMTVDPGRVRYAHDFISGRRVRADQTSMNRLYVAEPMPSVTGSNADHRVPVRSSRIASVARLLARDLGLAVQMQPHDEAVARDLGEWTKAAAEDLNQIRGASIVTAGIGQPPAVHAVVAEINAALGNVGTTVIPTSVPSSLASPAARSIADLCARIREGSIETLFVIDTNPVFDAPADLNFLEVLNAVPLSIHYGLYVNETALQCEWHIPATHELEMWSDARAYDGTPSLLQPLIAPLYQGVSPHELLAAIQGISGSTGYEIVRSYWREQIGEANFDSWWRESLHAGIAKEPQGPQPRISSTNDRAGTQPTAATQSVAAEAPPTSDDELEIVFKPDPRVWDGRFANNAWLQELPQPVTTLTWDNAAFLSPSLGRKLNLKTGQRVTLKYREYEVQAPVLIMPGHAEDSVTVYFGRGRTAGGRVADGVGFNAYQLRTVDAPWFAEGLRVRQTAGEYPLAFTQYHHDDLKGRNVFHAGTIQQFREAPRSVLGEEYREPLLSLYQPYAYDGYKWGMNIDLTACIGCGVCTLACQAENNIPVVGKEGVRRQREMHWIRVDRYLEGDPHHPHMFHAPVPCMHCEKAPCELVCPVAATLHNDEGLNLMVYNRCIGTRYCSNNCPYKVRRFNFFDYIPDDGSTINLQFNPEVTVRDRGVMEKCTYCVQRIESARIAAQIADRRIREHEVVPACAQACPTAAIVFGDLNNPEHQVARLARQPHDYGMLSELNTRPRTTYLARIANPNPLLVEPT